MGMPDITSISSFDSVNNIDNVIPIELVFCFALLYQNRIPQTG